MNDAAAFHPIADPDASHRFAAALFDEWVAWGVAHVCVCPGSRSTALTLAAAQQAGLRCWSHIDERSAGFFALGLAKASRKPVALVCTSGTAAANFFPAVIEAHYSDVPLLILTADRPPELRECGAGQTIDQVRLYGSHVRWFAETPVPEAGEGALRYARAIASRAVAVAMGPPAGPVHLNLPFRDPMVGDRLEPPSVAAARGGSLATQASASRASFASPATSAPGRVGVARGAAAPRNEDVVELAEIARRCERGVVSCGPMDAEPALVLAIAKLASRLGWPLLADPTSQLRSGVHTGGTPVVSTSDLFLRDARCSAALAPEVVLRFGASPTSKSLRLWLEGDPPRHLVLVDAGAHWHDASHLATARLRVDPLAFCEALEQALGEDEISRSGDWLSTFMSAERATVRVLERKLDEEPEFLEPRAVRELALALPDEALLYVSNSMPVRDLDAFLPLSSRPLRVLANRGANGIDGVTSSALGAAAAQPQPVVLLTGDLAFLHDIGGLLAARRNAVSVTIVVFDNDGGGIFSFLPVARVADPEVFERHFRTPHGIELGPVAESLGAHVSYPTSWQHFRAALKDAISSEGASIVIVPIERDRSLRHHREIDRCVSEALEIELAGLALPGNAAEGVTE